MENILWYHYLDNDISQKIGPQTAPTRDFINKLTDAATHELWHHRLVHPGSKITDMIHNYVTGVPKLRRNQFYACGTCMVAKFKKSKIGKKRITLTKKIQQMLPKDIKDKLKLVDKDDFPTSSLKILGWTALTHGLWICKRLGLVSKR